MALISFFFSNLKLSKQDGYMLPIPQASTMTLIKANFNKRGRGHHQASGRKEGYQE